MNHCRHNLMLCRPIWLAVLSLIWVSPAPAADPPGSTPAGTGLLAGQPWQELSHGVSLYPPLGAKLQAFTGDDAVVRIQEPNRYLMSVYLRKRQAPVATVKPSAVDPNKSPKTPAVSREQPELTLDVVTETALRQLATAQPNAKVRQTKRFQISAPPAAVSATAPAATQGNKSSHIPGQILYFDIPDTKPWVLGQALAVVDPQTVLLVELQVAAGQFPSVQPLFEAVLQNVRIEDPAALMQQREAMLERGQNWLKTVEPAQWHKVLVGEQWMRIVAEQADVGYLRMRQSADKVLTKTGVRVELLSHIEADQQAFDSLKSFFLADDRSYEDWSIKVQVRLLKPGAKPNPKALRPESISLTETGVRSRDVITVRRQETTDIDFKESVWQRPAKGYLANAEQHLIHRLLPRTSSVEMGFYSYYDNRGKLTYRTDRLVPAPDGSFTVFTRPSPELPENAWRYDGQGRLLECDMGEGRRMVPASKPQIAAIWKTQIK